MRFLTWRELHDRGILPSRQHTRRLINKGIVPAPYRLGDAKRGRLTRLEADIEAYVARKAPERGRPRPREVARKLFCGDLRSDRHVRALARVTGV